MGKDKSKKSSEQQKRDASPKRSDEKETTQPKTNTENVKLIHVYTRQPECWICKKTTDLDVSGTADYWKCKINCFEDGKEPTPLPFGKKITTKLYDYRKALLGAKIGILDVFPKICEPRVHESHHGKYVWEGAYQVVFKEKYTIPSDVKWVEDSGFRFGSQLSIQTAIIWDPRQTKRETICEGAFPAERSLALLEPGRMWFHFENDNATRRPLPELIKLFSEHCIAAGIFVSKGRCIEIPLGDKYASKESNELSEIVTAKYKKLETKEKFIGCL